MKRGVSGAISLVIILISGILVFITFINLAYALPAITLTDLNEGIVNENMTLNRSSVIITLIPDENYGFIKYKDRRLCSPCYSGRTYIRTQRLLQGINDLEIWSEDFSIFYNNITFDSRVPRIIKISHSRNGTAYTNQGFTIEFVEKNMRKVEFYHKQTAEGEYIAEDITSNCSLISSDDRWTCVHDTNYSDGEFYFYFKVYDGIHSKESKRPYILLESLKPILTILSPTENLTFLDLSEGMAGINFKLSSTKSAKITYKINDNRQQTFCTSCSYHEKTIRLTNVGEYNFEFTAMDSAGNSDMKSLMVSVN
jgi:hypothetical protein